jgi:hypothetical protein
MPQIKSKITNKMLHRRYLPSKRVRYGTRVCKKRLGSFLCCRNLSRWSACREVADSSNGVFQPAIFRDIAQEALSFCRESLEVASQRIAAKQNPCGSIDSKLFLILHFLVLKDLVHDINLANTDGEAQSTQPSRFPYHQAATYLMIHQAPQTVSLGYLYSGLLLFSEV